MEVINYLLGYKDLKIVQNTDMFNFSLDSVLLANFVSLNKGITNVLDIGCGNAPIPMILSCKGDFSITGVEIQKDVYDLALKSVDINGLSDRIKLVNMDINDYYLDLESDSFDVITCNPPFFKVSEGSNLNSSQYKVIARHEVKLNLDQLFKVSRKLLKNGGVVSVVHRTDRLIDIIESMRSNNIEPKRIQLVYPHVGDESNMVLVEGSKNGRSGLKILPPMYTHNSDGSYTDSVMKFFEG